MYYATIKRCEKSAKLIWELDSFNKKLQSAKQPQDHDCLDFIDYQFAQKGYFKIGDDLLMPHASNQFDLLIDSGIVEHKIVCDGSFKYYVYNFDYKDDDELVFTQIGNTTRTPKLKTDGEIEKLTMAQFENIELSPSQIYDAILAENLPIVKQLSYAEMLLRILNKNLYVNRSFGDRLFTNLFSGILNFLKKLRNTAPYL